MNLDYQHLLPADFDPLSRVWIYQSSRPFTLAEVLAVEEKLNSFAEQWHAHGAGVKSFATVFFGQFIVLMADETHTQVSGCSTDSSVRMVKEIEQQFGVSLFDRQALAFVVKDKIQLIPMGQLAYAAENNFIGPNTLYFNNTVQTKKELAQNWLIQVKDSWIGKRFSFLTVAE